MAALLKAVRPEAAKWAAAAASAQNQVDATRALMNFLNMSTQIGLIAATLNGSDCVMAKRLMIVCTGADWNYGGGGGMTIGNLFTTKNSWDYFKLHPTIIDHELHHMNQSAMQGPLIYGIGYGIQSAISTANTGTYWKENWYEIEADLCLGGYKC